MRAFDDTARKLHFPAADEVQIVAKQQDDLVDLGVGGVVGEYDILVPNELAFGGFNLLRGREDMGVLREGAYAEKAKDNNKQFGFHVSTTILSEIYCKITTNSDFDRASIRNLLQNCNKFRLRQSYYLKFTANCEDARRL